MSKATSFPWLPGHRRHRGGPSAPRMAVTAVRIPDPRVTQLPLDFFPKGPQIFIHEGVRQSLERRFELAFDGPVQLAVTDNRRRMVTHHLTRGTLRVRVHMMFLGAPDKVLEALVRYVLEGHRAASQIIGQFIDQNLYRIRAAQPVTRPVRTKGRAHDLATIAEDVNARYFGAAHGDVLTTWGRRTRPAASRRASIKLGSYSPLERLIRVHPVLDQDWVPRYFVAYIVFHEMLHHAIPPVVVGGRTVMHPPEFSRREREFRKYERALQWEARHIDRLLRAA